MSPESMPAARPSEYPGILPPGVWTVDSAGSSLTFAVTHMVVATVNGSFADLAGTLEIAPGGEATGSGAVRVASVDTGEPARDERLRSPDFFDAEGYPEIAFRITAVEARDGRPPKVAGELTIRERTRALAFDAEVRHQGSAPRATLVLAGELSRRDFGLTWSHLLEAGGVSVGDKVRARLELALVRREPLEACTS